MNFREKRCHTFGLSCFTFTLLPGISVTSKLRFVARILKHLIQIFQQNATWRLKKTLHHLEGLLSQGPLTFLISKSLMVQSSSGMSETNVTLMFSKRVVP